jgi:pilus assembly protein CpaB
MMKNKALVIVLAGAVVFGLLAAMSVSKYTSGEAAGEMNNIVVAKVEIPLGTALNPEQLTVVPIPKASAPEQSFTKMEDLVGRVAITPMGPREPVTEYRLAPKGSLAGLAALVPDGYRAITVKVDDEAGVAGLLAPGMLVDLLSVVNPTDGGNQGPVSKIVLQNVKVLATGQNMAMPKEQVEAASVNSVTLLVTPEEAEKVVLSSYDARLRLIVRNYVDQKTYDTKGQKKQDLLIGDRAQPLPLVHSDLPAYNQNQYREQNYNPAPRRVRPLAALPPANWMESEVKQKAAPTPPPVKVQQVEVFSGKEKKTVEFPQ